MVSVRAAKSKGSAMEMDCEASLQQSYPDAYRTHERGYIKQYDIHSEEDKFVFECKRLKGMSWNQAEKIFRKLLLHTPEGYKAYLLFKSNFQPCLVMYITPRGILTVQTFFSVFGVNFIKHEPTRKVKAKVITKVDNFSLDYEV